MDSKYPTFKILMLPWLAHGHIFPYLELAKRILIRKNFHIYFCSTSINFNSIKNFIHKNSLDESIESVELHLQPSSELPPHYHTTKNLPSNLLMTLLKAFQTADSSFSNIISTLKPHLVIYDIFQPWAAKLASLQGIPCVHFAPYGAAMMSYVHYHYVSFNDKFPVQELCLKDHEKKTWDEFVGFLYENVFEEDKDVIFVNYKLSSDVVLLKTSRGFEGKYLDYISSVSHKKVVPIGPLVIENISYGEDSNIDVIKWLSNKSMHSTVFVSFGSEYFLSKNEIEEVAKGINFIWVIRFPIGETTIGIEDAFLKVFYYRVKDRGIFLTGWAPQAKIFAHPSIGGFVSHCGWSSFTESFYFGVPVIAMPMKFDHPINARMLSEVGSCVEVLPNENGIFKGDEIAEAIKKVFEEKSGEKVRVRARELSEKMRMEEDQDLDEMVEELWQLCSKNEPIEY
ncbi:UDP-glucuronosyl and UDP-glucosyl transferase [Handroanthus impetiginosus]|uniref:UDP-glucuronosyl and UDP-glucosyl transferase n=1 Tax=Handroanthus impetiginosus TaxID=429701 RepID=A0A2G9GTB2_9LAMI|nr:UDP-glucuronosyl and UDP-glucosyl transferase [Handroanthus impetiginosus]